MYTTWTFPECVTTSADHLTKTTHQAAKCVIEFNDLFTDIQSTVLYNFEVYLI